MVTGRWIPGPPEDAALPVTRVTREELRMEGSPGIIDVLRNLSFSQGADGESDQYGSRTGADQAQLVVDVNLLPVAALESIEILREGAAATYGSDAIAGVVNFITRSDFEGIELEARHKAIDGSKGDDRLGLVAGTASTTAACAQTWGWPATSAKRSCPTGTTVPGA